MNKPVKRVLSYSEISTYRRDPLLHHMLYVERWQKPNREGTALSRGSLWHKVLESHYRRLAYLQREDGVVTDSPEYRADLLDTVTPLFSGDVSGQTEDEELIEWMYRGYLDLYGVDEQWEVLDVEKKFEEQLPMPDGSPSPYWLKGRLDLVVRDRSNGKVWVVDHKTGRSFPQLSELELMDQFAVYVWLVKRAGLPVIGAVHNSCRTQRNRADYPGYTGKLKPQQLTDRFVRNPINHSDDALESIVDDFVAVAINAYPEDVGLDRLPLYSSPIPNRFGYEPDYLRAFLAARDGADFQQQLELGGYTQNFTRH